MKLLFISTERGWYGGEEQLRLLVVGAHERGHMVRVAARQGGEFERRLHSAGVEVVPLPGSPRGLRSWWALRRAIASFRPDVLHANDSHALAVARWACLGLPRMVRVHARRVLFPIRSASKYRWCDRVVCVSHAIAQVCRAGGIPDSHITVVHEGVTPERVASGDRDRGRATLGLPPTTPVVLCVAQLAAYKGHRYLLDAWPAVLAAHPNAHLLLAGDGPLRDELATQIDRLAIRDSVRLLGYRSDVPDLLAACDLFTLASPEEGLGTSVLDAMFAQRAVVTTNAGGIPEMLGTGPDRAQRGWLVPPRDSVALGSALSAALGDPAACTSRATAARDHALTHFTNDVMVNRSLELFEVLCK